MNKFCILILSFLFVASNAFALTNEEKDEKLGTNRFYNEFYDINGDPAKPGEQMEIKKEAEQEQKLEEEKAKERKEYRDYYTGPWGHQDRGDGPISYGKGPLSGSQ